MSMSAIIGDRGLWETLEDSDFSARDNHYFVEIRKESPSSEAIFTHGELREDKLSEWVTQRPCNLTPSVISPTSGSDTGPRPVLRLLISQRTTRGPGLLPVPASRQTFEVVEKAWNLPSDFMETMRRRIPIAMNFLDSDSNPKMIGLTIRSVGSVDWQFCLTTNYNLISGTTTGIICGLTGNEVDTLIVELEYRKEDASDPLLFPVMAVGFSTLSFVESLEGIIFDTHRLEKKIGMVNVLEELTEDSRTVHSTLALDQITQDLTSEIRNLSFYEYAFKELLRATDLIQSTINMNALHVADGRHSLTSLPPNQRLRRTIAFMKNLLIGAQSAGIDLTRRLQAQTQIMFSLISQRDNKLNMDIAESSREISQASQRDSAAMKAIAEDSKRVALATQKDSASMRIIAAVTVVFLPGTFTATLFSASFFDFSSKAARVVSHWFWVYAVVTLMLTVGVCGVWWVRAAQREKDIDKLYGEEKVKTI